MRKHLRIIACYIRLNLASALEYRASFFSQAFGMALSNSFFVFFWYIAFGQMGGRIAGYSFQDVLFIWATASAAFGLCHILFENVEHLSQLIVTGELDTFLLQPCNVLVNFLFARTQLAAWGDLLYGVVLIALSQGGSLVTWAVFFLATLVGSVLMCAIVLTAQSLTFFLGNTGVLGSMAVEFIINFSIYPEKIYGALIRGVMYSIIPAALIVHVPLKVARGASLGWVALILGGAGVYCALSAWVFYRGLKKYESGNAIVLRQ